MKKILQAVVLLFLTALYSNTIIAQSFENGQFGIQLSDAGEVEIYSPDLTTANKQIDRFSILVAVQGDTAQVFDYGKDADSVMAAYNVESPSFGDYELYTMFDNSYSNAPPNLIVKINIFGWDGKSYALAKYTVINDTSLALDVRVGYEALPQVDGQYGFEVVKYEEDDDLVSVFVDSSSSTTGFKILSGNLTSVSVIDWFSGYNDFDSDFYEKLYSDEFESVYESGTDGTVIFMGGNDYSIQPGDSAEVWVGMAFGTDKAAMAGNMNDLAETYRTITDVKQFNNNLPENFELSQNYPNPFNPSTKINFSIPEAGFVNLSIFDALGRKVDEIINKEMSAGNYVYKFNSNRNFSSGVYFYTLQSGNSSLTKKMLLLK